MPDSYHIRADNLTRTFRIPVKRPGLGAAFASLIHRKFDDVRAVDSVGFTIGKGEMVGFIGPNGAGKTTTLKMLSGLLYPTAGSVTAAGFTPWKRKPEYLKKISMVMGNRQEMNWNTTVMDNMMVYKEIYGIPMPDFRNNLAELAELFDIGNCLQKQTRSLSLGERSKCEFANALLHKPEILYLDEPTLGMDVTMQLRLRQYIKEYNRKYDATVILTSHYMSDITSLCPRLMLIHHGKLVYDGRLSDLTNRFSSFRIIKLNLDDISLDQQKLDELKIPAELTESDGHEYTLRVRKTDSIMASSMLMRLNLVDFSIADPPIEAVIDKIYSEVQLAEAGEAAIDKFQIKTQPAADDEADNDKIYAEAQPAAGKEAAI
jgi:ABC-2 type transport system ATP-binding protein